MSALPTRSVLRLAAVLIATFPWSASAQSVLPPGDKTPHLRLETGGPRSYVSGLAFSRDGNTLYASGWDKAVLVWNQAADGRFEFTPRAALRVPTGAGLYGGLNTLSLSPDGQWLAVGGQGYATGISGQRESGWIVPVGILDVDAQLQQGLIYVFNTADRSTRLLRGHRGPVQAVAFVRGASKTPLLVSVAEERTDTSSDFQPVVRLWNVTTGAQVAELKSFSTAAASLPSLQGFRPGLAAWSFGDSPKQTRVALAWGDDQFRIWDVATGQVASAASSQNVLAVLPLDDQSARVFTGAHASVGTWQLGAALATAGKSLKKEQFLAAPAPSVNGKVQNLAAAAALIPSQGGAPPRIACVVTHYLPGNQGEYRLLLFEAGRTLKLLGEVPLGWTGGIRQVAVAASPDGTRLALAGSDRDEIEVHLVSDLLNRRANRGQVLASAGLIFQDAEFVQADGAWGLKLSPEAQNTGSIVADFRNRTLELAAPRWTSARADEAGWSIKPAATGKLRVDGPGTSNIEITLDTGFTPTCQAVIPASKFCPVPLAAVGSQFRGQPRLQLFRADTGESLRWCVGHTEKLNSVSFSADGRMLVSTGDDRVVSVWTLTDLAGNTLGKHGRIAGLAVDVRDNKLIVRSAPPELPLKVGDEIVGVLRSREIIGVRTAKELYEYALALEPGTPLDMTIRRNGATQTVTCPVAQAIDEVKPLFSLFVSPSANGREWQWIGWHPLGNFDSRGEDVDGWLGWQFNTGDLERPARYAAIGDYRDTFYRRDLLAQLIDAQKLVAATVKEDPRLSIWLEDAEGNVLSTQSDSFPRVSSGNLRVHAEVTGVPMKSVQSLAVSLDDSPVGTLQPSSDGHWTADLSQLRWQRGRRRISVKLKTGQREVTQLVRVQYTPAAPKLRWQPAWSPAAEIRENEVAVEATIQPATEPFEARLLIHRPGTAEPTVLKTWSGAEELAIREPVSIAPGENRLELEVWNQGTSAAERPAEMTRQAAVVRRAIPEAPRVQIDAVLGGGKEGMLQPIEPVELVHRSGQPQFRIQGSIEATDNISTALLEFGGTQRQMAGFQPGASRMFKFDELLTIPPGTTSVVVRSAVGGRSADRTVSLSYQPQTPTIARFQSDVAPLKPLPESIAGYLDGVLFEGYHEQVVLLTATLQGDLSQHYSVEFLADDQKIEPGQIQIDRSAPAEHVLTARLPLAGGRQSFSLRVSNEWSTESSFRQIDLELRRPPRIDELLAPERLAGTPLDVVAKVHSVLPLRSARLMLDESIEVPNLRIEQDASAPDRWVISAGNIGLAEGEHQFELTVANDDGVSLLPARRAVQMDKPPVAPPTLTILSPAARDASLTVAAPRLEIEYRIDSAAPAGVQFEVRGGPQQPVVEPFVVPDTDVPAGGLVKRQLIELFEGVNEISLQAHNRGGFSDKAVLRIAYVPAAATVEIVSVGDLKPRLRNDGTGYFDQPASQSYLPLKGRVKLHDPAMAKRPLSARIWVNLFKLPTVPVVFDEKEPGIGTFSTDVVFNRDNNLISVEIFGSEGRVASELGCTNELVVQCQVPDQKQELYLLLLGTGNGEELRTKTRGALKAKALTSQQASQEVWASDAFSRIHVHDAMNVPSAAVQNRLRELIGKMHNNLRTGTPGSLHSVVMVVFQGKLTLVPDDFSLATAASTGLQSRPLTGRILEEYLSRAYGAHLIFLDLIDSDQQLQARDIWPRAPHLGIKISSWHGMGEKPEDAQLTTILERSMPQARYVKDLAEGIERQYQLVEDRYPGQIENVDFLKGIYDLRIGGGGQ
ncbi:WD domain, G-beta repeat [Caulifigura coniformis]|uniref:WD domain, G-beta repeat n=1 Tax=Caulifigura coniformis TaxID=2527983 RepID=A0A517SI53_9PLAN|nr:WD40 repeat domain-containing protein [Caulifigura coniformis]QDT55803.1 WD domain, G-beta repeat [Caulifigura coniformis]